MLLLVMLKPVKMDLNYVLKKQWLAVLITWVNANFLQNHLFKHWFSVMSFHYSLHQHNVAFMVKYLFVNLPQ